MRRSYPPGPLCLSALLLGGALPAAAQEWHAQAGLSSAQVIRGLVYIEGPLAELSGRWSNGQGWSAGATAARALDAPQASMAASAGYGWPVADGVDAYVALGRAAYRREAGWRLRYDDARVSVNLHDRLFVTLNRLFDVHGRIPAGAGYGPTYGSGEGLLAKEALWRQPLPHGLSVVAGAGHAKLRGPGSRSYWYGSVGLRATVRDIDLEATFIDTGSGPARWWGAQAGQRWVGSARWYF